ncbi:hypothetical protein CBW24_07815 [Pacificitalea manganoxidans]|uniref:Uncharacterized protein n=1 Tax=Pacificitalea manganoxidans TaxID=1411902 RepID=A0A291LYU6_9RHOB|nr:hypothetical protein [Pacificitalea manganoxidans]ATI41916.1 hypothetical protein CBW24_07815 [Pacificitalea manganoxidans]MDR6309402.1 hypothetical protein [Pacificitalea manganoxidans]
MVLDVHEQLLSEIDEFLRDFGMSQTYFGKRAAGNSELVSRLRAGRSITGLTEQKVRAFITERRGGIGLQPESAA